MSRSSYSSFSSSLDSPSQHSPSYPMHFPSPAMRNQTYTSHSGSTALELLTLSDLRQNALFTDLEEKLQSARDNERQSAQEALQLSRQLLVFQKENSELKLLVVKLENELERQKTGACPPRAYSLAPSDSISQGPSLAPTQRQPSYHEPRRKIQPATRPSSYDESIIWLIDDAKKFGLVGSTNPSRPSMRKCIRRPGWAGEVATPLSRSEFEALRVIVRNAVARILVPLRLTDGRNNEPRAKTFYTTNFRREWDQTLDEIEDAEGLVALCAGRWKAEQLVMNCLRATKEEVLNPRSQRTAGESERRIDPTTSVPPSNKRSHESTRLEGEAAKKRKKKEGTVASTVESSESVGKPSTLTTPHEQAEIGDLAEPIASQTRPTGAVSTVHKRVNFVDTSFIKVNHSVSSLRDEFSSDPHLTLIEDAANLLDAMAAAPEFKAGKASEDTEKFLALIDGADHNSDAIDEEDKRESWGHWQFTKTELKVRTVLTNWISIGDTQTACKLIAAAVKTCRVARQVCLELRCAASSYLADIYLQQMVSAIWDAWKTAGGPIPKGKSKAAGPTLPMSTCSENERGEDGTKTANEIEGASSVIDLEKLKKLLDTRTATKEIIAKVIKEHSITQSAPSRPGPRNKNDLVTAVLNHAKLHNNSVALFEELQQAISESTAPKSKRTSEKKS